MNAEIIAMLAKYRLAIGYLGEKDQFGWWQSAFFTPGSSAFLSPLFTRTQLLAQCNGVTRSAALVHDERIGVGHVYHLFRLPEDLEQGLHQVLHDPALGETISKVVANKDAALGFLRQQSRGSDGAAIGPTQVGKVGALRERDVWQLAVGLYCRGFESGQPIFPYFTDAA